MSVDTVQWAAIIGLSVVVLGLAALLVGLLRSYADLVRSLHDLGVRVDPDQQPAAPDLVPLAGSDRGPAADIVGETLEGSRRAITVTGGSGPLLLAFLSSGCGTCMEFWRELRSSGSIESVDAPVVVVTKGPRREEPGRLAELSAPEVTLVMSDDAWKAYDIPVTPHFILLDRRTGEVHGEGSAPDPKALGALLQRATADARNVSRRSFLKGGEG